MERLSNIANYPLAIQQVFSAVQPFVQSNEMPLWIFRGALKGFLVYSIPMSLLRRRVTRPILQRSSAIAIYVAAIRACDCWFSNHSKVKTQPEYLEPRKEQLRQVLIKYRYGVYGGIAALLALLADSSLESSIFICWSGIRALRSLTPDSKYYGIISLVTLCLSSSAVLAGWIATPQDVDSAYLRFLDVHGGQSREKMKIVRKLPQGEICMLLHPDHSTCSSFYFDFFIKESKRAVKLYFPLHFVMFLLSTKKSPLILSENLLRSTLFLSSYCTLAWASGCLMYRYYPGLSYTKLFMHTWLSGLSGIFERTGRRIELASYVSTYALDAIFRSLQRKGWFTPRSSLGWSFLIICSMILIHNHPDQPYFFTNWLLGFDRVSSNRKVALLPLLHSTKREVIRVAQSLQHTSSLM